jgi:hypothetical protein
VFTARYELDLYIKQSALRLNGVKVKEIYAAFHLTGRANKQSPGCHRGPLGFSSTSVEVGFMVDELAQVEFLLRVLRYSAVRIILSMLHSNLFLNAIKIVYS